jgi:16S rRNA (uracil1498-N3)-methyltransferase
MEWLLEKMVEIGVQQVSFLLCDNSERKIINTQRLKKKAISAIKQSQNPFLPEVDEVQSYGDFIMNAVQESERFICHAAAGQGNFLSDLASPGSSYLILVGPEGDFSEDELNMAERHGFAPVSLGNNRLRTETAGLVACILLHALNAQA